MTKELCKWVTCFKYCVLESLNVLQCYLFLVLAFSFFLRLQLLFFKLWELEKCICEWVHFRKKIVSARAVHRGNYAETVKYAGWGGSGHILKAQPKQNPSVSTSSPWQHYLKRPSLGRTYLCLQRAARASPSQHRILPISLPLSLPAFCLGPGAKAKRRNFCREQ